MGSSSKDEITCGGQGSPCIAWVAHQCHLCALWRDTSPYTFVYFETLRLWLVCSCMFLVALLIFSFSHCCKSELCLKKYTCLRCLLFTSFEFWNSIKLYLLTFSQKNETVSWTRSNLIMSVNHTMNWNAPFNKRHNDDTTWLTNL